MPFFSLVSLFFFKIGEIDLVQDAILVVDEQLLKAISLDAKSSILITQLNISKCIDIVSGLLIFEEGHVVIPPLMYAG